MGVPAFYRWLSQKYPKIIRDCIEDQASYVEGEEVPVDTTQPNPNGTEFDNLYLDMNGIIHPCFHPEDRAPPTTETEIFQCIFDYIDRLFGIVRPRKLLYMAIDGVAPRAKMNQQRSRRFRAAQDAKEKEEEEERLRVEFKKQGIKVPKKDKAEVFDSNVITPGTGFMHRLSIALQYYVHLRLNNDPGWRNVVVILSDANVPGEGEHKIMSYVREQRGRPGWNPNTRHCLYGLDADLIMLGLATHEPRFVILREVVFQPNKDSKDSIREQLTARNDDKKSAEHVKETAEQKALKPFQFLMVNILREYLALELNVQAPFPLDVERIYDDFVFMCFFVGNDFLPHMPTLEIREGAIELLMHTYKHQLPLIGYLTNGCNVMMGPVEKFIEVVGALEDQIFQKRMRLLQRDKNRRARDRQNGDQGRNGREPNRKWTAAAPNANFQASLKPAIQQPAGSRGAVLLETMQMGQKPAGGGNSNRKAADALRDRMRAEAAQKESTKRGSSEELEHPPGLDKKRQKTADGSAVAVNSSSKEADVNGVQEAEKKPEHGVQEPERKLENAEAAAFWTDLENAVEKNAPTANGTAQNETTATAAVKGDESATGDNDESAEDVAADDGYDPMETENKELAERFKGEMHDRMKDRGDMFDEMVLHEEQIRLGETGWKARYYETKTGLPEGQQEEVVKDMVKCYVEGLCWVLRYYYDGVASWTWYYPYHYAPFASDLKDLSSMTIEFELGDPFKPFNQLMGVFPAASAHALPKPYRHLFTDAKSPIRDFYPQHFKVDMNGKRFAWQGVALLPFIDEKRLLAATGPLEAELSEDETWRNGKRLDQMYVSAANPICPDLYDLGSKGEEEPHMEHSMPLDPQLLGGMVGEVLPPGGQVCPLIVTAPYSVGEDITSNGVCCCAYRNPPHQKHITRPLPDQSLEPKQVDISDLQAPKPLWHEDTRGRGGPHGQYNPPQFPNQPGMQQAGPLSNAAHRMLSHSLAGVSMNGQPGAAPQGYYQSGYGQQPVQYGQQQPVQLNPGAQSFRPGVQYQAAPQQPAYYAPQQQTGYYAPPGLQQGGYLAPQYNAPMQHAPVQYQQPPVQYQQAPVQYGQVQYSQGGYPQQQGYAPQQSYQQQPYGNVPLRNSNPYSALQRGNQRR